VKLEVSGSDFVNFKVWNTTQIQTKETSFSGIVSNVSPSPDIQTKLYKIEVGFIKNPVVPLTIWDFIDVILHKTISQDVIISVPFSSIITLDAGRYGIYSVNKDDTVKLNYVVLGKKNATHVEIISGLDEWMEYIVEGALGLNEGDVIERVEK
jgi:hypothetical protein